jgi:hypothetical protein
MSTTRWMVKNLNDDTFLDVHSTEKNAVAQAIFLNSKHDTDSYYVEKFDKKKTDAWFRFASSIVDKTVDDIKNKIEYR